MEAEYYEQEAYENQLQLINDLAKRTASESITWRDVDYNPIGVLETDDEKGNLEYVLTQMFTCTADLSGIIYDIDLSENIDILTGKGDIYITVTKTGVAGFDKFDLMLSVDSAYDDTPFDMLLEAYREHPILVFADQLIEKLYDSDEVKETFEWASFLNQDIPEPITHQHIFKIGKKLFDNQDVLGFHKCVMDSEYRNHIR